MGCGQARFVAIMCVCVCVGHVVVGGVLGWDLLVASLSSSVEWEQAEVFYLQARTGLTYDRTLHVSDQFEWHRERS